MAFQDDMDRLKFDTRLVEFQIRHGQIKKEEVEKHLQSLQDSASNSEKIKLFDESQLNGSSEHSLN